MPERIHKKMAYHAPDSRMARIYSHLNDDDVEEALHAEYSKKQGPEKGVEKAAQTLLNLLITPETAGYLIEKAVASGNENTFNELITFLKPTVLKGEPNQL